MDFWRPAGYPHRYIPRRNTLLERVLLIVIVAGLIAYLFLGITPNSIGAEKRVQQYCEFVERSKSITPELLETTARSHRLRLDDPQQHDWEEMRADWCGRQNLKPLPFALAWQGRTGFAMQLSCCYVVYENDRIRAVQFFETDGEYCSFYLHSDSLLNHSCSSSP